MANNLISTAHLDYLQRSGVKLPDASSLQKFTTAQMESRLLWHINGVGQVDKSPQKTPEKEYRSPYEDLIIGMHGLRMPMAFFVQGSNQGVKIHWGTWGRESVTQNITNKSHFRQAMLKTSLEAIYPEIYLSESKFGNLNYTNVGFSLGIPTSKPFNPIDGSMAIDRLIRAMGDSNWGLLILAEPAEENAISHLRGNIVEETRRIKSAVESKQAPLPLIKHYEELLGESLKNATKGIALGSWRTGVYLMGDKLSYYHLASLWRGLYTGDKSLLEPIRNKQFQPVFDWINNWALPDTKATIGPGFFSHPLAFQSILTSQQLSAYCHLPQLETPGFFISNVPDFDTVPEEFFEKETIKLGRIMKHGKLINQNYEIALSKLTKHVFVAGVTGSGKSNTIFHLLKEISKKEIPFLIIEPAKTEYRALLNDPVLEDKLHVFTCGDELTAPFRLNPFEVISGASVSVHIDLLRSVFTASFGLWSPLPQILERCIHEIYADRGWDIINNTNSRLDDLEYSYLAYPTLTDLAAKVKEVVISLGYAERVTSDMSAALLTRITSLRTGGKGRLFDVQQSVPIEKLMSTPTVLELEAIGDDDDKAFLMGLVLTRLVTYQRQQKQSADLRHLLVIEEAHRLLTNVGGRGKQEDANPRAKAVETFSNLLSEIRAYGQGVLIADQVPVKLAPDVIKNTNLKIAHRIVAIDDRKIMAGAMAMNEKRANALGILSTGEAVLFNEGDDAPLLVKIDFAKVKNDLIPNKQVSDTLKRSSIYTKSIFYSNSACSSDCYTHMDLCNISKKLLGDPSFQNTFSRVVLSLIHDEEAIDRLWPDLKTYVQAIRPANAKLQYLWPSIASHAAYWYANKMGAQAQWTYSQTQKLTELLEQVILHKSMGKATAKDRRGLQQFLISLHERKFDPFPLCSKICNNPSTLCLYRMSTFNLINKPNFSKDWSLAIELDKEQNTSSFTWHVCRDVAYELMEFADDLWELKKKQLNHTESQKLSLCFAQQKLMNDPNMANSKALQKTIRLIKQANHG